MKKTIRICALLALILSLLMLTACSGGDTAASRTGGGTTTVSDVLSAGGAAAVTAAPTQAESVETKATDATPVKVDVDLTAMSSTMVYSEVYNMVNTPDEYLGRTVKMEGLFTSMHDEASGNYYFACIIEDATACCAQGIEFVLTDEYSYPDDYPTEGSRVSVVGTFDTYYEGQYRYCTLREAKLV